MVDKASFGKIIKSYKGSGHLFFDDGVQLVCSFEIVQQITGQLYAFCEVLDPLWLKYVLEKDFSELIGETEEGCRVRFYENSGILFSRTLEKGGEIICSCRFLTIEAPQQPAIKGYKFYITNLILSEGFQIDLDEFMISFNPVKNYKPTIDKLKISKSTVITYQILVLLDKDRNKKDVEEMVGNLCLLLTFARGSYISWLYYNSMDSSGEIVNNHHMDAITKPYEEKPIIPGFSGQVTKNFITEAYWNFVRSKDEWGLDKAIKTYTDGLLETDFIENRALKLVTVMEYLKSRYFSHGNTEYIMESSTFNSEVKSIKSKLKEVLVSTFPGEDPKKYEMMTSHVEGLNGLSFSQVLKGICKDIRLNVNSKERRRYINIRNNMVHRLQLFTSTGSKDGWINYCFVVTFIGKVILAILEYDGDYNDWTCFDQGKMKMRKEMKLLNKVERN